MKHIFILALITLLFSCNKKDPAPVEPTYIGEVTAEYNGEPWKADVRITRNTNETGLMSISFSKHNETTKLDEICSFSNIPIATGVYRIPTDPPNATANTLMRVNFFMVEYDAIYARYAVLDNATNTLEITSVDANTKEVKGTVDFTFLANFKSPPVTLDTIRLKQGVFYGKINN